MTTAATRNGKKAEPMFDDVVKKHAQPLERNGASTRTRPVVESKEPTRGRNLKMTDSLYDALCLYARKTKVKVTTIQKMDGRETVVTYSRSLTISEANTRAVTTLLRAAKMLPASEEASATEQENPAAVDATETEQGG